jgi:hypothetical protein
MNWCFKPKNMLTNHADKWVFINTTIVEKEDTLAYITNQFNTLLGNSTGPIKSKIKKACVEIKHIKTNVTETTYLDVDDCFIGAVSRSIYNLNLTIKRKKTESPSLDHTVRATHSGTSDSLFTYSGYNYTDNTICSGGTTHFYLDEALLRVGGDV